MSEDIIVSYCGGAPAVPGWRTITVGGDFTRPPPAPPHRRLVLLGFSAGAQALRAQLLAGVEPDAIVAVDGIHGGWPDVAAWQLDPWLRYAARARRREAAFVITHIRQQYTEKLAQKPFASTLTMARRISGWRLDEPLATTRDGGFVVKSYPSTDCDAAAHRHQGQVVLPDVLREAIAMLDGVDREAVTPREPSAPPIADTDPAPAPTDGLGVRALALGLTFIGTHEIAGPKANPVIAGWLARCQRNGKPLGLSSDEIAWCAAFASACAFDACHGAERPPHGYRASVAELWEDASNGGAARPAEWQPGVGDLAIFSRAGGDPRRGGTGHVARIVVVPDASGAFVTLDGNHDNRVAAVKRMRDASLVGWVEYPTTLAAIDPGRAGQLVAIADAAMRGQFGIDALDDIVGSV